MADAVSGKSEYKPIDMGNYPYETGQVLDNGIEIVSVVRGTALDSLKGYGYRKKIYDEDNRPSLSSVLVIKTVDDPDENVVNGIWFNPKYQSIGPIGEPMAQMVMFKCPGDKLPKTLRPAEFLEFLKNYGVSKTVEFNPKSDSLSLAKINDLPAEYVSLLGSAGYETAEDILTAGVEKLKEIKGVGDARAKEIFEICEIALS